MKNQLRILGFIGFSVLHLSLQAFAEEEGEGKDVSVVDTVVEATSKHEGVLGEVQGRVPEAAQFGIARAREALLRGHQTAVGAVGSALGLESLGQSARGRMSQLRLLREQDPVAFREQLDQLRAQVKEKLEKLREENPEKFKEFAQHRREHFKKRAERLREENPEKFREFMAKHRNRLDRRAEWIKEYHPEQYEKFLDRRQHQLAQLGKNHPKRLQEFLENHPHLKERFQNRPWDRREDIRDKYEDILDRREDIRDARFDGGRRDRLEDLRDRREDRRDLRQDLRDLRQGPGVQARGTAQRPGAQGIQRPGPFQGPQGIQRPQRGARSGGAGGRRIARS